MYYTYYRILWLSNPGHTPNGLLISVACVYWDWGTVSLFVNGNFNTLVATTTVIYSLLHLVWWLVVTNSDVLFVWIVWINLISLSITCDLLSKTFSPQRQCMYICNRALKHLCHTNSYCVLQHTAALSVRLVAKCYNYKLSITTIYIGNTHTQLP